MKSSHRREQALKLLQTVEKNRRPGEKARCRQVGSGVLLLYKPRRAQGHWEGEPEHPKIAAFCPPEL